jgi:hypothetical protein
MVKKTKRNNRSRKLRGGFNWPWSKNVEPIPEEETAGLLSYLGLDNIKLPDLPDLSEIPEFSRLYSSNNTPTYNSAIFASNNTPTDNSTTFASNTMPTDNSTVAPISTINSTMGGRRRSRRMRKGGSRGLGLTYYATPVDGIKVAEPTYMEYYTGGKRGKKTRKQHRKKCKKNCRKSHRHIR